MNVLILLFFVMGGYLIEQTKAGCVPSDYFTPKGKPCPAGVCTPTVTWSVANVPYYPMEFLTTESVRFTNDTIAADLEEFLSVDHFNTCNFTNSFPYPIPIDLGCRFGEVYLGSQAYCNQGLKMKMTHTDVACSSLTTLVGTNGLPYVSEYNWIANNQTLSPITLPVSSKLVFNYTSGPDVRMFASKAHFDNCNFTEDVEVTGNAFCVYKVKSK